MLGGLPMMFTADIVRVMGISLEDAELFLQKYGDWQVEILDKTVRGITPEELLRVGKCATEEERLRSQGDARWVDVQRVGQNRGGRPRKIDKASLADGENRAQGNDPRGHDNSLPPFLEIHEHSVPKERVLPTS